MALELTPDERRGITEMSGEGEVVSGIALQAGVFKKGTRSYERPGRSGLAIDSRGDPPPDPRS